MCVCVCVCGLFFLLLVFSLYPILVAINRDLYYYGFSFVFPAREPPNSSRFLCKVCVKRLIIHIHPTSHCWINFFCAMVNAIQHFRSPYYARLIQSQEQKKNISIIQFCGKMRNNIRFIVRSKGYEKMEKKPHCHDEIYKMTLLFLRLFFLLLFFSNRKQVGLKC